MLRCQACGNEGTFYVYETITQLIEVTPTPEPPSSYAVHRVVESYPAESEWGNIICGACGYEMDNQTARESYNREHESE